MPPAARITDMHVCPMFDGPVPHVGGPILPPGASTVLIDFLPAATVTSMATCVGPPDVIVMGSTGVFINFLPAARLGDQTAHGGVIVMGSPTCIIGEVGTPSPGSAGLGGVVAGLAASGVAGQFMANASVYGKGASPAAQNSTISSAPPKTRKNRMPSKSNKYIDHSKTTHNPDGSTTYYDLQSRPVKYSKEGYPDFAPYAETTVHVQGMKGKIPPDDELANEIAGFESTPDDYTWHHHQDGKTMQLIPTDVHSTFPHTGGASVLRSKN